MLAILTLAIGSPPATAEAPEQRFALKEPLVLADAEGKLLASNGDYFGKDPLVEFVAPKDGEYLATLNDLRRSLAGKRVDVDPD